jgi:ABC-type multidrug transport system fused ATPase/permease subunit
VPQLPDPDLGLPDLRSAERYLLWLARRQWRTLAVGIGLGTVWMLSQAVVPWMIGRTIDAGVGHRDAWALTRWCGALLGVGLLQTLTGVMRHRFAVWNWLSAAMRSAQLVGTHVARAGTAVSARLTTGEAVSTVANDSPRVGELYDVSQRFFGSLVAFVAVGVLLLHLDVGLGLLVLVAVPALTTSLALVVRPLQRRQAAQREAEGRLTALGADTVAGLRVLRGIGGEDQFVERYRLRSQAVRAAGVRVAALQATLDSAQVLLPGAFVVLLTWLGAHAVADGRITIGQLVTLYGYAAFLVLPLSTATEALGKSVRSRVAAGRIVRVLRQQPRHHGPAPLDGGQSAAGRPPRPSDPGVILHDPASGLRVPRGRFTALVCAVQDDATRLAHRLARLDADEPEGTQPDGTPPEGAQLDGAQPDGTQPDGTQPAPRLDGVPVDRMPVTALRGRVLVSEAEPRLFTGTLRTEVDPYGRYSDDDVLRALHVADAHDVLDALPERLEATIEERGRSLSGGQRQRLALARAVLADPEVLVLVEPTSAVDAHTEARIADRLRQARTGRTTLVTTASPLLLDRADEVALLVAGRVVATGRHHELLRADHRYRETVTRGEDL